MKRAQTFIIVDKTANNGKPYITEDGNNTGDMCTAWGFNFEAAAEEVILENGWSWAYVLKIS